MKKKVVMRPGDTIAGVFDKIRKGDTVRILSTDVKESGVRAEATRRNRMAKITSEIPAWEKKFSVSNTEKEGFISITRN